MVQIGIVRIQPLQQLLRAATHGLGTVVHGFLPGKLLALLGDALLLQLLHALAVKPHFAHDEHAQGAGHNAQQRGGAEKDRNKFQNQAVFHCLSPSILYPWPHTTFK